jgi:hypothetical protein
VSRAAVRPPGHFPGLGGGNGAGYAGGCLDGENVDTEITGGRVTCLEARESRYQEKRRSPKWGKSQHLFPTPGDITLRSHQATLSTLAKAPDSPVAPLSAPGGPDMPPRPALTPLRPAQRRASFTVPARQPQDILLPGGPLAGRPFGGSDDRARTQSPGADCPGGHCHCRHGGPQRVDGGPGSVRGGLRDPRRGPGRLRQAAAPPPVGRRNRKISCCGPAKCLPATVSSRRFFGGSRCQPVLPCCQGRNWLADTRYSAVHAFNRTVFGSVRLPPNHLADRASL